VGRIIGETRPASVYDPHPLTASGARRALPSLRQLRLFLAVSEHISMRAAAQTMNTSRSSITKTIKKLEQHVGCCLLVRTSRVLSLTEQGQALAAVSRRAIGHLQDAEAALTGCKGNGRRKFAAHLTTSHLLALIAVIANRSYTLAAMQLQVTQPAITMALQDLQNAVGASLLLKDPSGVSPTTDGALLADAARRAIAELESMGDVVRIEPRPAPERVVIGVLPLAGTFVPAKAVESFLESFPNANLTLVEGPYASLLRGLRAGEIDLIIGGLSSPASEPDIAHQQLYDEEVMVAVRTSHPLAQRRVVSMEQLLRHKWIVPRLNTPARNSLEAILRDHHIEMPACTIETNSIITTRSLLMDSERVAFITRSQMQLDERIGVITTLVLDKPRPHVPVGVRLRLDSKPNDTVQGFLGHLRQTGLDYANTH
jgi:LysR family transcriptional regulator of gallate degradation